MLLGLHKYSVHKPINCHGPSHRYYPLYPTNLNSLQIMLIISLPKLGCKITLSPHKAQHHLAYGQNSKKAQNSKSPTTMWLIPKSHTTMWLIPKSPTTIWLIPKSHTTMWLIPKSHYDVANSMSHYDVANSKPATMRHYLQNPLRCGTIYKVRCYTAP